MPEGYGRLRLRWCGPRQNATVVRTRTTLPPRVRFLRWTRDTARHIAVLLRRAEVDGQPRPVRPHDGAIDRLEIFPAKSAPL
jgi:hypothetical protein